MNTITQNPVLLPYTCGRKLDNIYLDTTFAIRTVPYREFSSKADGLKDLLMKMSRYPPQALFHFHAWTFGYEEVWIALASALGSQVRGAGNLGFQSLSYTRFM